jgi:hypothetical protein
VYQACVVKESFSLAICPDFVSPRVEIWGDS